MTEQPTDATLLVTEEQYVARRGGHDSKCCSHRMPTACNCRVAEWRDAYRAGAMQAAAPTPNGEGVAGWIASERIDYSTSPARDVDFDAWAMGYEACLAMLERYIATPINSEGLDALVEAARHVVDVLRTLAEGPHAPMPATYLRLADEISAALEAVRAGDGR